MRTLARLINDFAEAHGGRLPRSVSETLDYWQADESLGWDGGPEYRLFRIGEPFHAP